MDFIWGRAFVTSTGLSLILWVLNKTNDLGGLPKECSLTYTQVLITHLIMRAKNKKMVPINHFSWGKNTHKILEHIGRGKIP